MTLVQQDELKRMRLCLWSHERTASFKAHGMTFWGPCRPPRCSWKHTDRQHVYRYDRRLKHNTTTWTCVFLSFFLSLVLSQCKCLNNRQTTIYERAIPKCACVPFYRCKFPKCPNEKDIKLCLDWVRWKKLSVRFIQKTLWKYSHPRNVMTQTLNYFFVWICLLPSPYS